MTSRTMPATAIAAGSHTRVADSQKRPGCGRRSPVMGATLPLLGAGDAAGGRARYTSRAMPPQNPDSSALTRRALLGSATGAAAALAYGRLPAWARPVAAVAGVRRPDSLPFPHHRAGTESMPEIKHAVVLMMENHSFDTLLRRVAHE